MSDSFWAYYKSVKRSIDKDDLKWARDNIVLACLLPLAPTLLGLLLYGIYPEPKTLVLTLWIYAVVLTVFVLIILIRAPWRFHQDRESTHCAEVGVLQDSLLQISTDLKHLSAPPDRPKLAFCAWRGLTPAEVHNSVDAERRGFVIKNDGGAALEVAVCYFAVGDTRLAASPTIPRIGTNGEEFFPIFVLDEHPLMKWRLDLVLRREWEKQYNGNKIGMRCSAPLQTRHMGPCLK